MEGHEDDFGGVPPTLNVAQQLQNPPLAVGFAAFAGFALPGQQPVNDDGDTNTGNTAHDDLSSSNQLEFYLGLGGSIVRPLMNTQLPNMLVITNTGEEVTQSPQVWSTLPLSPCCEGGVNVRGSLAVLNAARSSVLPPKPFMIPPRKHKKTGLSILESIPRELLQHIVGLLAKSPSRVALWLTSKSIMHTLGTRNLRLRPQNRERVALMSLLERDADDLVYCNQCRRMHYPVPFHNRHGWRNGPARPCERPATNGSYEEKIPVVCWPLKVRRLMVRWATNLHGAGKQHLVDQVCQQHFRERKIRGAPNGEDTPWIETQRDVRVAENTSHVLLRTRHIVSFLDLCRKSGSLPSHRSIFYLVHYLKTEIKGDICQHEAWAANPDLATFHQLENELTFNPHLAGNADGSDYETGPCSDSELVVRSHRSSLEPIEESGRPHRIGGCCLFHPAPCSEAIAGCKLPTRGVVKSCRRCYTDYQWDVLYKDDIEGEPKDEPRVEDASSKEPSGQWKERVLVLTTWKNLGRGCKCTGHLLDSHEEPYYYPETVPATNATRLPPNFVPTGAEAAPNSSDGPPPGDGPKRSEWASDIFRAYEGRSAVV